MRIILLAWILLLLIVSPVISNQQQIETENFIVCGHNFTQIRRISQLAEAWRTAIQQRWFSSKVQQPWNSKCRLYLLPAAEYKRQNGAGQGESSSVRDGSAIIFRTIRLNADFPDIERSVLPHEVTHQVMRDKFGARSLPAWADEGIAVMSEPPDEWKNHLRNVTSDVTVSEILSMANVPSGARNRGFYAVSYALISGLVSQGGPARLVECFRRIHRDGYYDDGFRDYYGIHSIGDLARYIDGQIVEQNGFGWACRTGRCQQVIVSPPVATYTWEPIVIQQPTQPKPAISSEPIQPKPSSIQESLDLGPLLDRIKANEQADQLHQQEMNEVRGQLNAGLSVEDIDEILNSTYLTVEFLGKNDEVVKTLKVPITGTLRLPPIYVEVQENGVLTRRTVPLGRGFKLVQDLEEK